VLKIQTQEKMNVSFITLVAIGNGFIANHIELRPYRGIYYITVQGPLKALSEAMATPVFLFNLETQ